MSNSYGRLFRITTFGESHGPAIGVVIDGCPAGLTLSLEEVQRDLNRRRPGQSAITSPRQETDEVQVLSGVFEGKTTGTPLTLLLRNQDARPQDYDHLAQAFRPSHADYTYAAKYGHRDYRGGGRSSARETAARVAAGAVARQLLAFSGIRVQAYVSQVGHVRALHPYHALDLSLTDANPVRCPDPEAAAQMLELD